MRLSNASSSQRWNLAASGEVGIAVIEEGFRRNDGALRLIEKLLRLAPHAASASSRAVGRNGVRPCCQSRRVTNTRLTLTECLRDSEAMSALVRSTSAE